MSFQLVQACIDMRGGLLTPAQKASLLVICRFADDKGMNSFPKLETIAERTEFNRRTILEAVKGLIENGWITAVRTQYGRNFSVSVNKIMANKADTADVQEPAHVHEVTHMKEPAHVQETTSRCAGLCTADVQEPAHRRDQLKEQEENSNYSRDLFDDSYQKANRGAAKTEKTQRNSLIQKENRGAPLMAPNPADGDGKNADNPLNQKENKGADTPVRTSSAKKTAFCTVEKPEDVPGQLWADFVTHRKAKKAPITETVIKRTRSEAAKCSMTLSQAIEMMVARGWQGFEARFVLDNRPKNQFCPDYRESTPAPNPAHNPFIPRRAKTPEELQAEKEQREAEELFGGLFR